MEELHGVSVPCAARTAAAVKLRPPAKLQPSRHRCEAAGSKLREARRSEPRHSNPTSL